MTRIKICGVRSVADARLADRCGADAVGVLVGQKHTSNDFVTPETAEEICLAVGPFLTPVLVTHLEDEEQILALAKRIPCTAVQLHSDLAPATLRRLRELLWPRKIIGKVSVENESAIDRAIALAGSVDAIVLDSIDRSTSRVGGTGRVHDWSISARIAAASRVPIILAGGLTPANVALAIAKVNPWAVDVNSGVSHPEGGKNEALVRAFIEAARGR